MVAREYQNMGKLPEGVVPSSMPLIQGTLDLVINIKERIRAGKVTLKDSLRMALLIEESAFEKHFQETISREAGSEVVKKLQKLLPDTKPHAAKIKEFIRDSGFDIN